MKHAVSYSSLFNQIKGTGACTFFLSGKPFDCCLPAFFFKERYLKNIQIFSKVEYSSLASSRNLTLLVGPK